LLVLSRKKDESILIGDDIEIIITDISDDKVKIGIRAPKTMKIFRKELIIEVENENKNAAEGQKLDLGKISEIIKK